MGLPACWGDGTRTLERDPGGRWKRRERGEAPVPIDEWGGGGQSQGHMGPPTPDREHALADAGKAGPGPGGDMSVTVPFTCHLLLRASHFSSSFPLYLSFCVTQDLSGFK